MTSAPLHLVDRRGFPLPKEIGKALQSAFRWAQWQFPLVDAALIAGWAEEVGAAMAERPIQSPDRYAIAALHGKVRGYYRSGGLMETNVGASHDLELWAGIQDQSTKTMDRSILFDQLKMQLNERDRIILVLLRQDVTSPADIADALDLSYDAAAKAIQRVKQRLRDVLLSASKDSQPKKEPQR